MISVIIPCYNSEAFVARAIESVLLQTYTDYEILLVDNNSTDKTVSILHSFQSRYPHLIKVFHEPKKGAPAARNKGLREANGEWIQFLDSDDEIMPEKLSEQLPLTHNPAIDIIVGHSYYIKTVANRQHKRIEYAELHNVWKGLIISRLGNTCANLWRRNALLAIDGWNESRTSSQEYDLLFRLLKNNSNIGYTTTPQTVVYVRENSIHKSSDANRICEILNNVVQVRMEIKAYLKEKGKLTKELDHAIGKVIYIRLMKFKEIVPDFVSKKLKEIDIKVPISYKLKLYIKPRIEQLIKLDYKRAAL